MTTGHSRWTRLYRTRIDPRSAPTEAHGYWLIVLGVVMALSGVAVFLWGSTYPRGGDAYWTYRQAGIVLVAVGLPLELLGTAFRLRLQPIAGALGGLGVLTSVAAVVWFTLLYPSGWTYVGPRPVILTYAAGIALLAVAITAVPMVASPLPASDGRLRQPYYTLSEGRDGWTWRLHGDDGTTLAESGDSFPGPAAARAAIDDLSVAAPTAGTEVIAPEVDSWR